MSGRRRPWAEGRCAQEGERRGARPGLWCLLVDSVPLILFPETMPFPHLCRVCVCSPIVNL